MLASDDRDERPRRGRPGSPEGLGSRPGRSPLVLEAERRLLLERPGPRRRQGSSRPGARRSPSASWTVERARRPRRGRFGRSGARSCRPRRPSSWSRTRAIPRAMPSSTVSRSTPARASTPRHRQPRTDCPRAPARPRGRRPAPSPRTPSTTGARSRATGTPRPRLAGRQLLRERDERAARPAGALDPVDGRVVAHRDARACACATRSIPRATPSRTTSRFATRAARSWPRRPGSLPAAPRPTWTVTPPLAEDRSFTWTARASDGRRSSAPGALPPPSGSTPSPSRRRRRSRCCPRTGRWSRSGVRLWWSQNATSPDGLAAHLHVRARGGGRGRLDDAGRSGGGRRDATTRPRWTPSLDLADGAYHGGPAPPTRGRAGPWSPTARFDVLVDPATRRPDRPAARVAGDARVRLDWNASPEPDVTGYRVYRAHHVGRALRASRPRRRPPYEDLGLTNGMTYYYVVTALDARVGERALGRGGGPPEEPAVSWRRYASIRRRCSAGCLGSASRARASARSVLAHATLELERGRDPLSIDVASAPGARRRRRGRPPSARSATPTATGIADVRVRFPLRLVAALLSPGRTRSGSSAARAASISPVRRGSTWSRSRRRLR